MENSYMQQLVDSRLNVWEHGKALLDHAADEKRELTADEDAEWARINADLDRLDEQITEKRSALERARAAEEARVEYEALVTPVEARAAEDADVGDDDETILRSILRGEIRAYEFGRHGIAREHRDVTTGSTGAPAATNHRSHGGRRADAVDLDNHPGRSQQPPDSSEYGGQYGGDHQRRCRGVGV